MFSPNTSLPQGGKNLLLLKVKIWEKECIWSQLMSGAHLLVRDEQGDLLIVVRLFPEKGEEILQENWVTLV